MNTNHLKYKSEQTEKVNLRQLVQRYQYSDETKEIIEKENLITEGILQRLHNAYPKYSGLAETSKFLFTGKKQYSGLEGFREIIKILSDNGIMIDCLEERELFIKVYRFMATKHALNSINWQNFNHDSIFQLIFPQPRMIRKDIVDAYLNAESEEAIEQIVRNYITETNPHDGKQKLNKPIFKNDDGEYEVVEGAQHKYPQCHLIFDVQTQYCFAFCTYCFRHAQVRGDEDMFLQKDIDQIHRYLKQHKEVTDILITGGDAGYLTPDRFEKYINPIIEDAELSHIKTIRLGTRVLTYNPELILSKSYEKMLNLFKKLNDNGIQLVVMSHFSTPRELLNPSTIAAIRRLRVYGAVLKSQSPIMNHISLFTKPDGSIDIDESAQNWIDLGNLLAMLSVGFHSMYCARPTGEHHYFTAPLADINKIFSKVYRSLASINRPSRYITMTSSAGKISMMGTVEIKGEKLFVLKFNEARNMEWIDKVYLAKYDEKENTIEKLKPFDAEKHFFEDELIEIERQLHDTIEQNILNIQQAEVYDQ
jgi:L-lysine 2,3-aminomutase